MNLRLHAVYGACSLAPHILLREAGAAFDLQMWQMPDTKSAAFLAINPAGAVPVLEIDGAVLTQNVAILDWISRTLLPSQQATPEPLARARLLEALSLLASDVHKAFVPIFHPPALTDEAICHAGLKTKAVANVRHHLARLEPRLAAAPFLLGNAMTAADPYLFVILRWAQRFAGGLADFPALDAWQDIYRKRPAVDAALDSERKALQATP